MRAQAGGRRVDDVGVVGDAVARAIEFIPKQIVALAASEPPATSAELEAT